jgi:hypothetical protein
MCRHLKNIFFYSVLLKSSFAITPAPHLCYKFLNRDNPTETPQKTPKEISKDIARIQNEIENIMNDSTGEDWEKLDIKIHKRLSSFDETSQLNAREETQKIIDKKKKLEELFRELFQYQKQKALQSPKDADAFLKKTGIKVDVEEFDSTRDKAHIKVGEESLEEKLRSKISESNMLIKQKRLSPQRKLQRIFEETVFADAHGEKWDLFAFRDSIRSSDLLKYVFELEQKFLEEDAQQIVNRSLSDRYSATHSSRSSTKPSVAKKLLSNEEGQKFQENLKIFESPISQLGENRKTGEVLPEAQLTNEERKQLGEAAFKILTKNGENSSNAQHLGDHFEVLKNPAVSQELKKAGIDIEEAKLLVLLHDLGKEYDQTPQEYKDVIEKIFPKAPRGNADTHFLNRNIMAHEFGSMAMIDDLCSKLNIAPAKRDRLKALIAGHNAGYEKLSEGNHFWQTMWPKFANEMSEKGANLPSEYPPLRSTLEGQNPLTIILTAADRFASKTLASQEKFADTLVKSGRWNNHALADQMASSLKNVQSEGENVLSKLEDSRGKNYAALKKAITDHFQEADQSLSTLSQTLPQMSSGKGKYTDRPALSENEIKNSLIYCQEKTNSQGKKDRTWYKIDTNGKVSRYKKKLFGLSGEWVQVPELSSSDTSPLSPTDILFKKFIYPDRGYSAPKLSQESL